MSPALPNINKFFSEKGQKNWYYVYLLKSVKTKWIYPASARRSWIYIGCTRDLEKRLVEHMNGNVFSTKRMLPVELIYFEAYKSKEYAYKREKQLKRYGSGLSKLKSRIGIKK